MRKFETTPEGQEFIRMVFNHSEAKRVVELAQHLEGFQKQDLLATNLTNSSDRDLIIKKARLEGAERLIRDLQDFIKSIQEA